MIAALIIARFAMEPQLLTYVEIVVANALDSVLQQHSRMLFAKESNSVDQLVHGGHTVS